MNKEQKKGVHATCTWGHGPDVVLDVTDHIFILYEHPTMEGFRHGTVKRGSTDLTADEAIRLGNELVNAALHAKELEQSAKDFFEAEAKHLAEKGYPEAPNLSKDGCKKGTDGKCCGQHHKPDAINIYTDGACSGNPGPGAAAFMIKAGDKVVAQCVEVCEETTTNIRMELIAVINALTYALDHGFLQSKITLYSDSEYVVNGITKWITNWKTNGWRNAAKKPVANSMLWQDLDALNIQLDVEWLWVRGHNGHPENEIVDTMAQDACPKVQR